MKNFNLEKALFPKVNELVISEGCASALIVDEELDPIECDFINDGCVTLNTSSFSYLTLSVENLKTLMKLIKKVENYYELNYKEEDDEVF